jgi:type IV secretory pathway VirB10-like protein
MSTVPPRPRTREIEYPSGDGKPMAETEIHSSQVLGLHLERDGRQLRLFDPATGRRLPTRLEARQAAEWRADEEHRRADEERRRADEERRRADEERRSADEQHRRAESAELAEQRLAEENERLRREIEALRRE